MSERLIDTPEKPFVRLVLAHGAGAGMESDFMQRFADCLVKHNIEVIRFEFPYMRSMRLDGKRRLPDRQSKLLQAWKEQIDALPDEALPLFIGGKSMGGRMATIWASENTSQIKGIVCLGYPFHPIGKPEKRRIDHFPSIKVPVLVVQGEKDAFGSKDEVTQYALGQNLEIHWIASADHDLKPKFRGAKNQDSCLEEAAVLVSHFLRKCLTQ